MPAPQLKSMQEPMASFNRTAFIKELPCCESRSSNVRLVSCSAWKLWMIRIPEMSSWINAFRLEDFFRKSCHFLCERVCMNQIQMIINGRLLRDAAARAGFFTNMMATTAATVIKSGISVVTKLFKTSFNELMSPMILARIFPVGRLSKNCRSRVWIWVYRSWRMVTRMRLQTFAIMYMRSLTPPIIKRFRITATMISRVSPGILPAEI